MLAWELVQNRKICKLDEKDEDQLIREKIISFRRIIDNELVQVILIFFRRLYTKYILVESVLRQESWDRYCLDNEKVLKIKISQWFELEDLIKQQKHFEFQMSVFYS